MIAMVEADQIGILLAKDMSRIGRNYLEVGFYTEILFPKHNVRFIAINSGVDSANQMDNDFTPFLNIINEFYVKDSSKKVRASMKQKGESGEYLTTNPPYVQKSENRLAELDRLFKRIYEDMVGGKLTEARFQMLADDYEQEQAELREKIDILEEEIGRQEDQTENVDKFIRQAKKYLHLEKLTPTVLNDLVKAVYVHAPDKSSGHRVQDVEISYNYIGILPATLLYDLQNEKTA